MSKSRKTITKVPKEQSRKYIFATAQISDVGPDFPTTLRNILKENGSKGFNLVGTMQVGGVVYLMFSKPAAP